MNVLSKLAVPVLYLLLSATPSVLCSQEVRGFVRDASTRFPVSGALVRADSVGTVTVTGADGAFLLRRIPKGTHLLSFQAFGYRTATIEVKVPLESPLEISLAPAPLELPGLEVVAETFQTRFDRVQTDLDYRIARLPGHTRVVEAKNIRPYDQRHAKDPWIFLAREMRLGWDMNPDAVRIRGIGRNPEVYIDDRRTWLFRLVEMPLSKVCRVELYEPPPAGVFAIFDDMIPLQLRAYTCTFLAQVATGRRTLKPRVNYGDLIAGPGGGSL